MPILTVLSILETLEAPDMQYTPRQLIDQLFIKIRKFIELINNYTFLNFHIFILWTIRSHGIRIPQARFRVYTRSVSGSIPGAFQGLYQAHFRVYTGRVSGSIPGAFQGLYQERFRVYTRSVSESIPGAFQGLYQEH